MYRDRGGAEEEQDWAGERESCGQPAPGQGFGGQQAEKGPAAPPFLEASVNRVNSSLQCKRRWAP